MDVPRVEDSRVEEMEPLIIAVCKEVGVGFCVPPSLPVLAPPNLHRKH